MLKRYGTPRSVFTLAMLIGCFLVFYAFTFQMASEIILGILAFLAGTFCNAYSSINAACAEIWSIRTAGFNNGIVNTVGQLTGATALAMSGYWAVKYADKAGGYASEFAGVWYLGMIISAIAALCALYVLYVEKKAMQKHKQAITCETSRTENVACDQKSDQSR
jgi:phage-related minor tail protein